MKERNSGRAKTAPPRRSHSVYLPIILGLALLVVAGVWVVHARFVGATGDSGFTWQADGLSGDTVHYLVLGHGSKPIAFAATESGVYRRDAGGSWTRVLAQPGVWSVDLLPDNRTVIAGDQQGHVDLSTDAGHQWRAARVSTDAIYAVTFVGRRRGSILAGAGGGLFRSQDGGATWVRRLALHDSAIAAFTHAPGSGGLIFAGAVASGSTGSTGVYASRDAGVTWTPYGSRLQSGGGIMALAVSTGSRLLAGTMGQAVWAVDGPAGKWARTAAGLPARNDHVAGIALVPGQPKTAYIGTLGFGVFETRNGGKHWTNISDGLRGSTNAMIVLSLAYSPAEHRLYAGTSTGVYRLATATPITG